MLQDSVQSLPKTHTYSLAVIAMDASQVPASSDAPAAVSTTGAVLSNTGADLTCKIFTLRVPMNDITETALGELVIIVKKGSNACIAMAS
jgi:hypothetical protein